MVRQDSSAQRKEIYEEISPKRNPYLVDYEGSRRTRGTRLMESPRAYRELTSGGSAGTGRQMPVKPRALRKEQESVPVRNRDRYDDFEWEDSWEDADMEQEVRPQGRRSRDAVSARRFEEYQPSAASRHIASRDIPLEDRYGDRRKTVSAGRGANRYQRTAPNRVPVHQAEDSRRIASRPASRQTQARRAARIRRQKQILMRKMIIGVWVLCIIAFGIVFAIRNHRAGAKDSRGDLLYMSEEGGENQQIPQTGALVQGIPAEVFATHPEWKEDLLTPNEYSRPGDALEAVNSIFVHYTANPGTSAAQNRSYFEWQKDTHEASVSAHFVIGYDGEIIQCVPLDEIAYAVMTRNYDSISIECCYLEKDGSFTQATYDSLISLLAWLTDAYDLESDDILRHYDCGGKKCPLYYTEHEDAWEQLKKDVDNL